MKRLSRAGLYALLSATFLLTTVYQVAISRDTIHVQRNLDFYIPLLVKPFTPEVEEIDTTVNWEVSQAQKYSVLQRRDVLLEVNGKPFTGTSILFRELWDVLHQAPPAPPTFLTNPFVVTVMGRDSVRRKIQIGFPHCHCGIPGLWTATAMWMLPPLVCVVLGLATVFVRPTSKLAWAWLGLMLSLSQLQFWSEPYLGFQFTASPMLWPDPWRIPAVAYRAFFQNVWPAAVVGAVLHLVGVRGRGTHRLAGVLIAVFFCFATLKAALAVAFSEDYRALAPMYRLLEEFRSEAIIAGLLGIALLAWTASWRAGVIMSLIAAGATAALFRTAAPLTTGQWINYSSYRRFEAVMPAAHNTPELVVLLCAAASLLTVLLIFRRTVSWPVFAALGLFAPLAVHSGGAWGRFWYPVGPQFEYWPWFMLACAGAGAVWMTVVIVRCSRPSVFDKQLQTGERLVPLL
jgi:hypothetical protein